MEEHPGCSSGSFTESFRRLNLPENVVNILSSSCSKSTWNHYESVIKKYYNFCQANLYVPFPVTINVILQFLTSLYESGLGYSSINLARSALSVMFGRVDNIVLGEHPLVSRFIKGVGRLRPPVPRYQTTWDVNLVLNLFLKWHSNDKLNLKDLTLKLVALLALASGQRAQTLCAIQLDNIKESANRIEIYITKQLKTSAPSVKQPCIILPSSHSVKQLCVASVLREYIIRTSTIRRCNQLFISFKSPYNLVCTQTVSRWLVNVLALSEVDISHFKGHSFRHASTSKAFSSGVKIDSIFRSAGWSSGSTAFARFYNRPVTTNETNFADAVLK